MGWAETICARAAAARNSKSVTGVHRRYPGRPISFIAQSRKLDRNPCGTVALQWSWRISGRTPGRLG